MSKHLIFGKQNEPVVVASEQEARSLCAGGFFSMTKRNVSSDGPGFSEPAYKPNSAVAAGTDREIRPGEMTRGPQGEILEPTSEQGIFCPLCGQDFPEVCSEDGGQVSDPTQSLRKALADYWDWEDPDDDEEEDLARRENIMTLFRAARLTRCSS